MSLSSAEALSWGFLKPGVRSPQDTACFLRELRGDQEQKGGGLQTSTLNILCSRTERWRFADCHHIYILLKLLAEPEEKFSTLQDTFQEQTGNRSECCGDGNSLLVFPRRRLWLSVIWHILSVWAEGFNACWQKDKLKNNRREKVACGPEPQNKAFVHLVISFLSV